MEGYYFKVGHPQYNSGRTHFKKGNPGYWLGKKRDPEVIRKMLEARKLLAPWNKGKKSPYMVGDKNPLWKGDDVGYGGLHKWIYRKLGQPNYCAHCQTITAKRYEWANISHEYKRDLSDWIRLCTSCHKKFDNKFQKPKRWRADGTLR